VWPHAVRLACGLGVGWKVLRVVCPGRALDRRYGLLSDAWGSVVAAVREFQGSLSELKRNSSQSPEPAHSTRCWPMSHASEVT
jgi:hypothetical protein